jgi:diguanylate cyclase (GGDEF)-like protein/PAS domain S-box-containing protein
MFENITNRDIARVLVALLFLSFIAIFGIMFSSATIVDEEVHTTSLNSVRSVLDEKSAQLALLTKDYGYWDDTIEHAYRNQDADWIKDNLGEYLTNTFNVTDVYVIDGDNRPLLQLMRGQQVATPLPIDDEPLQLLLDRARTSGDDPVPASGLLRIDGQLALVAASLLEPEGEPTLPAPKPVLVMAWRLTSEFLSELAQRFAFSGLELAEHALPDDNFAYLPLIDAQGKTRAYLAWQPEKPGKRVLGKALVPVAVLFVLIVLVSMLIMRHAGLLNSNIRRASQRIKVATDAGGIGIWEYDFKTQRLAWDDWMLRLYGIQREKFSGHIDSWVNALHPEDRDTAIRETENTLARRENYDSEFRVVHPDGSIRYLKAYATTVRDHDGNPIKTVGVNYDITKRKQMEEELKYLSTHDPLTGLHNRMQLERFLIEEARRAERYDHALSVFMVDIDFFKRINDSHGHAAGDQVLKAFSLTLQGSVRDIDFVARYGGEEFVIAMPETPLEAARKLAERLFSAVQRLEVDIADGTRIQLHVSMGVATFPRHATTWEGLLEAADLALYSAKEGGRNQFRIVGE